MSGRGARKPCGMRNFSRVSSQLTRWARVARWLLGIRAGLMRSTLVSASVIYLIGCVIPTPLEEEPLPVNYPPVLTKADPPFGPLAHQRSDPFDLKVFADDPNIQDILKIR